MATTQRRTSSTSARKPAATKPAPAPKKEAPKEPGAVSGNLTFDPELRFTPSGRAVCNISIASNDRVLNEDTGEWEDTEPEYHRITVWGQMGENIAETLQKGDRIVAIGYWQEREWEDKEGNPRTSTELVARDIGPSMLWNAARIQRARRNSR